MELRARVRARRGASTGELGGLRLVVEFGFTLGLTLAVHQLDLYYGQHNALTPEAFMLAEQMLNVRLPRELAAQLDTLTKRTGRTESALTVEALRGNLNAENWQIADIQSGVEEAIQGKFASTEEVTAFFAKFDC